MQMQDLIDASADGRPVLIAGPTASGKSALALAIARAHGGMIVNADALQVFARWHVLTARPDEADLRAAPHALYGHVTADQPYSVGHWLREVAPLLTGRQRPIIVGGTGLYLSALTEGLADIPATPPDVRARADALPLGVLLGQIDAQTLDRIDTANRARVQRAWEVRQSTGRGLAAWQNDTPLPLLAPRDCLRIVIEAPRERLSPRIATRFDRMLAAGALDEARAALPDFDPARPADRAIGAPELIAHLRAEISLDDARDAAVIATRQYAKRQRTWFARRMKDWRSVAL